MGRFFQTNKPQDIDFIRELPQDLMLNNAQLEAQRQAVLGSGMDLASQFTVNTFADPVYQNQISGKREELANQMQELVADMQQNGSSLASKQRANQIANELANWRNTVGDNMERDYANFGETIKRMEEDDSFSPNRIHQYKMETMKRLQNNDPTNKDFQFASGANFAGEFKSQEELRKLIKPEENTFKTVSGEEFDKMLDFQYRNRLSLIEGYNNNSIYQASVGQLLNQEDFIQDNLTRYNYNLNGEKTSAGYKNYRENEVVKDSTTGMLKVVPRSEPLPDDQDSFIAYKAHTESMLYSDSLSKNETNVKDTKYTDDFGMDSSLEAIKQRNRKDLKDYDKKINTPILTSDYGTRIKTLDEQSPKERYTSVTSQLNTTRRSLSDAKRKLNFLSGDPNSEQYLEAKRVVESLEQQEKSAVSAISSVFNSTKDLLLSKVQDSTLTEEDSLLAQESLLELQRLESEAKDSDGNVDIEILFDNYEKFKEEFSTKQEWRGNSGTTKKVFFNKDITDYLDKTLKSAQTTASLATSVNSLNTNTDLGKKAIPVAVSLLHSDIDLATAQEQLETEQGRWFFSNEEEKQSQLNEIKNKQELKAKLLSDKIEGVNLDIDPINKIGTYTFLNNEGVIVSVNQNFTDEDFEQIKRRSVSPNVKNGKITGVASQKYIEDLEGVFKPHDNITHVNEVLKQASQENNNQTGHITTYIDPQTSTPITYFKANNELDRTQLNEYVPIEGDYYIQSNNSYDPNSNNQDYQLRNRKGAIGRKQIYDKVKGDFETKKVIIKEGEFDVKFNKKPYLDPSTNQEYQVIEATDNNGIKKLLITSTVKEEDETIDDYFSKIGFTNSNFVPLVKLNMTTYK